MMTDPKRQLYDINEYGRHYLHTVWCPNCGKRNYCYIPKKTKIKDCAPIVCDNCECDVELGK